MTLSEFKRALEAALHLHFPNARLAFAESRGVAFTCRAELRADVLLTVYFNALTGNTSYALIRQGQWVAGYDNHRFWHAHPWEPPTSTSRVTNRHPKGPLLN